MKVLVSLLAASVLALAAVAPAGAAPPSLKEVESAAKTIRAVTGPLITAPGPFVMVKKLPVRIALRLPKGTTGVQVKVRNKDLSRRFRGGGRERSARVDRSDGLRWGTNKVTVIAERGKRPPVIHARTFYLVRASQGVVELGTKSNGSVLRVSMNLREPSSLGLTQIGQPQAFSRSLDALHRKRIVRLRLNGKPVNRAIGSSSLDHWTANLSAAQGLRYGVNRLEAYVAEPEAGRFQVIHRKLRVKRAGPLASAGWDRYSKVGGEVRLDGRRSKVAGGGKRELRWQIVSKPQGSKATLGRANSARPRLAPDLPGRYLVRLTASERIAGAKASASASASSSDLTEVTAAPKQLLIPFTGFVPAAGGKPAGVQVGGTFYPKPSQGEFQFLTLERSSLEPHGTGNSWFGKEESGEHSIKGLFETIKRLGHDQLVVLAMPFNGTATVNSEEVDEFNSVLNLLGVPSLKAEELTAGNQQFVVVGIPYGGMGSGFVQVSTGAARTAFKGYLMPDGGPASNLDLNFRLVPERIEFDTEESSSASTNTITIGEQSLQGSLEAGVLGGFQVVVLDPFTFAPLFNKTFPTNTEGVGGGVLSGRRELAQLLGEQSQAGNLVAVQSIGKVGNFVRPNAEEQFATDMGNAWIQISNGLGLLGANPYNFNLLKTPGSYAFLGGSKLSRGQVADSSSPVLLNPSAGKPMYEEGSLHGRATVNAKGVFEPVIASSVETPDLKLYDYVFSPPTAWPLSKAAGTKEAKRYEEALAYVSGELGRGKNIRETYWDNLGVTYSDKTIKMNGLAYGGTGKTCSGGRAQNEGPPGGRPGYTKVQFCEMTKQLQLEFEYLDKVKSMFDSYEKAFSQSGPLQQAELQSVGTKIVEAVKPSEASEILWSLGEFAANLIAAGLTAGASEEAEAGWEVVVASYEVTRELIGATGGEPLSDQIESKVGELGTDLAQSLYGASDGIKRMRQVVISDWGRLSEVGKVAETSGWTVDEPTVAANVTLAAEVKFSSELMPIPYGVWMLQGTGFNGNPNAENCYTLAWGHTFRYAPEQVKIEWPIGRQYVLGVHYPSVTRYSYPPQELAEKIFSPYAQKGYGVSLPEYIWEEYEGVTSTAEFGPSPPTDVAYCH